ncbi:MAG: bifunctional phosphoglucose/phosphomannose isomerase [Actinobacteria bacterium]|nr:bifunctional phosphoglucose/phosphomannose isomerase [Actinomycetota bacterium]
MSRLDDLDLSRLDPAGMLAAVTSSPQQWGEAAELALSAPRPGVTASDVSAIVVAGMGGSGIVGDIAVELAAPHGVAPVLAVKGYELPGLVGPDTLVVTVSYSGDTEETLSCLDQALEAGATVYAVTSGGQVSELAAERGFPIVLVPGGRQPRASHGYLSGPVVGVLDQIGAAPGAVDDLLQIAPVLEPLVGDWGPHVPTAQNPVKQAAEELADLVPVFYGGTGWTALAALRGKCQVNENGKRPAFHAVLPELDHNEVVGWSGRDDLQAGFGLVALRDPAAEHAQVAKRFEVTLDLVGTGFGAVRSYTVPTDASPLARFAAATLYVDLLSVYLALLDEVDPSPVDVITELKQRIAVP